MTESSAQTGRDDEPPAPSGEPMVPESPVEGAPAMPQRYRVTEADARRVLTCLETPTVIVRIDRDLSLTDSAARQYPKGTIFLDGAAHTRPFVDAKRHVLNLDHHHGCVRPFTLASCEQALIMVRKGLDLQAREWCVYANEPDLDTILAIWVLLNHMRLTGGRPEILAKAIPLVRLEGCIDVHGLEMQDLCGFPEPFLRERFAELEQLQSRATELRAAAGGDLDPLEFTVAMLHEVDALIYSPLDLEEIEKVEELVRSDLPNDSFVVACHSERAVYQAEKMLRRLYGPRLGVLVLQKTPSIYTLRQVDPFLPATLQQVYQRLNLADPAAGNSRSGNLWGGSDEIGGSPRKTGTRLSVRQIVGICRSAYHRPTPMERAGAVARAFAGTAVALLAAWGLTLAGQVSTAERPLSPLPDLIAETGGLFALAFLLISAVSYLLAARRAPGLFGWRRPVDLDWLYLLPLALAGALAGGVWLPSAPDGGWTGAALAGAAALAVSTELWFRGLAFGLVMDHQRSGEGGGWTPSAPVVISALLYAFWTAMPFFDLPAAAAGGLTGGGAAAGAAGALVFGLSCGWIRERSESLLPPLLVHAGCLLILALAG